MKERQNLVFGAIAATNLILVLAFGYSFFSMKDAIWDRISKLETSTSHQQELQAELSSDDKKLADVVADLGVIKERIGVTSTELKRARETAQAMKRQQEQEAKQLASKANSADVDGLRKETTSKLDEFQQDSNTRFGNVSSQISGLKQDLVETKDDWGRQLVDVKSVLSEGIAKNSSELAALRKKGDRDYFEFDIRKNSKQPFSRVADIQLALLKTNPKNHKYNFAIQVDDYRLEKRDRTANEPVQFLVGREQLRYEVVVNSVEKDRIRGYM
ncbi:MAG: hypothetical protein J2P31_19825, partial [Blastocatellia bacterium]|nr:hypothetical protein [Blastocatellia bacterium]